MPNNYSALCGLAEIYYTKENYEKAKEYCSKLFNGKFIQLSLFKPYLCLDFACDDILNYYLFGETFLDDDAVKKTYETVMNGKAKTPWGVKIVALPDGEFLPLEGFMAGGKVHLTGLGTFEVKDRAGRMGRNLYTRESVDIPPYKAPIFHAGKSLKEAVH